VRAEYTARNEMLLSGWPRAVSAVPEGLSVVRAILRMSEEVLKAWMANSLSDMRWA